jgi:hypothetical protein
MDHAYSYDRLSVSGLLFSVIEANASAAALDWLKQQTIPRFNLTFTAIPRFIGKQPIRLTAEQQSALEQAHLFIQGYPLDRVARLWWLIQLPADDKAAYVQQIETLFNVADMNELVALYSALPLLPWQPEWKLRTAEGVRSNIGPVLEAIMYENVYPSQQLDEAAWNQLVMKAFFTEKDVNRITGLYERANPALANILKDWAAERQAAGREINPLVWKLIAKE